MSESTLYAYIPGYRVNNPISIGRFIIRDINFETIHEMDSDWITEMRFNRNHRAFITCKLNLDEDEQSIRREVDNFFYIIEAVTGVIGCIPSKGIIYIKKEGVITRYVGEFGRTLLITKVNNFCFLDSYIAKIKNAYETFLNIPDHEKEHCVLLMDFLNNTILWEKEIYETRDHSYNILPLLTAIEVFLRCENKTGIMQEIIKKSTDLLMSHSKQLLQKYTLNGISKIVRNFYEYRSALLHGRKPKIEIDEILLTTKLFFCDLSISYLYSVVVI